MKKLIKLGKDKELNYLIQINEFLIHLVYIFQHLIIIKLKIIFIKTHLYLI